MKHESGRSLIEVIATMAIATVMMAGTIGMYVMIRNNQTHSIASTELEKIAGDVKLLLEMRGDYTGVSVDYLIKAGALKNASAPIGGDGWSVSATTDGTAFSINLVDLNYGDCEYLVTAPHKWAKSMSVNGYSSDLGAQCMKSGPNNVSFIVE